MLLKKNLNNKQINLQRKTFVGTNFNLYIKPDYKWLTFKLKIQKITLVFYLTRKM